MDFHITGYGHEKHVHETGLYSSILPMTYNSIKHFDTGSTTLSYEENGDSTPDCSARMKDEEDFASSPNLAVPHNFPGLVVQPGSMETTLLSFQQYEQEPVYGHPRFERPCAGPSLVGHMHCGMYYQQQVYRVESPNVLHIGNTHQRGSTLDGCNFQSPRLIHPNTTTTTNDEVSEAPFSAIPHMPKNKKMNTGMEKGSWVLINEEKKELSSMERRQMRRRNSSRAFRSRRKEYINKLQRETACRANDICELNAQNRALCKENARLNDLVCSYLNSLQLSTINDMPDTIASLKEQARQQMLQDQMSRQFPVSKDSNAHRLRES